MKKQGRSYFAMMSDRKVLFFDVDGTLVSESKNEIPESSKKALTKAMEK